MVELRDKRILVIIRNSGLCVEDLAYVTDRVCNWIKRDDDKILVLNFPSPNADLVIKSMGQPVLHKEDRISVKVRLIEARTEVAEARTEVKLKRRT